MKINKKIFTLLIVITILLIGNMKNKENIKIIYKKGW